MRNSEKHKYSKGKGGYAGSSSKPVGKSKPWKEVKVSPETDLKATNLVINHKTGKGIVGKMFPNFAKISQY